MESAESYLRQHLESLVQAPVETPSILLNPDTHLRDLLVEKGEVQTPYLTIQASVLPFDPAKFIDEYREAALLELKAKAGTISDRDYTKVLSHIIGVATRLAIGMENIDQSKDPSYDLERLVFIGSKGTVDLSQLTSKGVKAVWNPYQNKKWSGFSPDAKVIMVCGDITSLEGVIIALHEMKHALDFIANPEQAAEYLRIMETMVLPSEKDLEDINPESREGWLKIIRETLPLTPSDMKLFLELERGAHAYALKQMRVLIDDRRILNALLANIHQYSLQTSSNILVPKLPF